MLDAQSSNASATFLTYDGTQWTPVLEDVGVLYSPQGTAYVNQSSGDVVQREERIIAPLGIDQHTGEGDRVTLHYRGQVFEWRITNFRSRSIDGVEGYCQFELEDYGDSDEGGSGGTDWDIGSE